LFSICQDQQRQQHQVLRLLVSPSLAAGSLLPFDLELAIEGYDAFSVQGYLINPFSQLVDKTKQEFLYIGMRPCNIPSVSLILLLATALTYDPL